ncbi:MAG: LicD family protein [Clostridia bacterium]|nr:LicD family protein [Clostridia bacterium]
MNYSEFILESRRYFSEDFCKEGQQYRDDLLSIMDAFHMVCVKREIDYYMGFGTLLGAIRDGGLIPWDFDMDLLVKYSDREMLWQALTDLLPDGFDFICKEKDATFEHFDMRIVKKGVHHRILHVDVFYLVDAPDDRESFVKYSKKLIKLANIRHCKLTKPLGFDGKTIRSKILLNKIKYMFVPMFYLNKVHARLCNKYVGKGTSSYFRTCISYRGTKYIYPKDWFSGKELIPFENRYYFAPLHAQDFLQMFYKNPMQYPDIETRFIELYNRIQQMRLYKKHNLYETEE